MLALNFQPGYGCVSNFASMNYQLDTALDGSIIHAIFGDDTQHLSAVLQDFMEEAPAFKQDLHTLYTPAQFSELKNIIHRFKPLYHYVGLTQAFQQLEAFEAAFNAQDLEVLNTFHQESVLHIDNALQLVLLEHNRIIQINNASHA